MSSKEISYRIIIEHVPSGKIWKSKVYIKDKGCFEAQQEHISGLIRAISKEAINYFSIITSEKEEIFFTLFTLKDCIVKIRTI
jgi:hypothetical protein